jgi:hypothetical protein
MDMASGQQKSAWQCNTARQCLKIYGCECLIKMQCLCCKRINRQSYAGIPAQHWPPACVPRTAPPLTRCCGQGLGNNWHPVYRAYSATFRFALFEIVLSACPISVRRKLAAASLSAYGASNARSKPRTHFWPNETCLLRSRLILPVVFISTNLTGLLGAFALTASHNRRVASVTSLRGAPNMPLKLMLCPRHDATASHPCTC